CRNEISPKPPLRGKPLDFACGAADAFGAERKPVPPENPETARWFATEVLPHRPALRAWLLARFPTLPDVDDLLQETLARLMQAREVSPIRSARALLFTTARNLALDLV